MHTPIIQTNKLRLNDATAGLGRFRAGLFPRGQRGRGRAHQSSAPTPKDSPLVIVDLVPEAGRIGHGQLELHTLLLDDCVGRAEWSGTGEGGLKWGGEGSGRPLTVCHRLQLQRLGYRPLQVQRGGLPYLGLEEGVHHCGLAQPALPWG